MKPFLIKAYRRVNSSNWREQITVEVVSNGNIVSTPLVLTNRDGARVMMKDFEENGWVQTILTLGPDGTIWFECSDGVKGELPYEDLTDPDMIRFYN